MEIGKLYSCKWKVWAANGDRGWDMLMLIGVDYVDAKPSRYVFYDVIHGVKRNIGRKLAWHCKEITKETACTR